MKINKLLASLATAAVLASAPASAELILSLETTAPLPFPGVPGASVVVTDGGAGDANAALGAVTFIGPLGNWIVNVTTGIGSAIFKAPRLDLSSVNVSSFPLPTAATPLSGALEIELTETDLTLASGVTQLVNFLGAIGGTTDGRISWWMYADDSNTAFGHSQLVGMGSTTAISFESGAFTALREITDTFSMTLRVVIEHGDGVRSTSFNFTGFVVPEPATVLLLGFGLVLLAFARRPARR